VNASTIGQVVDYQCSPDYHLQGRATSICLHSGNWTTPPTCALTTSTSVASTSAISQTTATSPTSSVTTTTSPTTTGYKSTTEDVFTIKETTPRPERATTPLIATTPRRRTAGWLFGGDISEEIDDQTTEQTAMHFSRSSFEETASSLYTEKPHTENYAATTVLPRSTTDLVTENYSNYTDINTQSSTITLNVTNTDLVTEDYPNDTDINTQSPVITLNDTETIDNVTTSSQLLSNYTSSGYSSSTVAMSTIVKEVKADLPKTAPPRFLKATLKSLMTTSNPTEAYERLAAKAQHDVLCACSTDQKLKTITYLNLVLIIILLITFTGGACFAVSFYRDIK